VNAATCQNSWEIPQIADYFRHAIAPIMIQISLQNGNIQ
jgi:hypothetical protein